MNRARNTPSLAVALKGCTRSNSLNADVKAIERLQIVPAGIPRLFVRENGAQDSPRRPVHAAGTMVHSSSTESTSSAKIHDLHFEPTPSGSSRRPGPASCAPFRKPCLLGQRMYYLFLLILGWRKEKMRILSADDDGIVCRGVAALLTGVREWTVCSEARSGEEAFQKARLPLHESVLRSGECTRNMIPSSADRSSWQFSSFPCQQDRCCEDHRMRK
jgi:hypothetical protein